MEPAPRLRSARPQTVVGLLLLLLTGCVTTQPLSSWVDEIKPHGPACQVVVTWQPEVLQAPDPVHGGAPSPCLAGRLYLFGQEIKEPQVGNGQVVVDLYDETPVLEGKPAVMLEQWRLDKDTLKRLAKKDVIGWGYSLYLPWGTYKPEIAQVRLRLRYEAPGAVPLYNESAPIILKNRVPLPAVAARMNAAGANVPVKPAVSSGPTPSALAPAGFAAERR
jgi:hypothetical protein